MAELFGWGPSFSAHAAQFVKSAAVSANPDMALKRALHYAKAIASPHNFFSYALEIPQLMDDLMTAFGGSEYLSAILIRHPGYLPWLLQTMDESGGEPLEKRAEELQNEMDGDRSGASKRAALRRFKRRETLRIGMRDLLQTASVDETTAELAAVADAAFRAAYLLAQAETRASLGAPLNADGSEAGYCVIGMGKLGGGELNFSSDVDILCVYSEDGNTDKGGANQTYFQRLTEKLIDIMSAPTQDGYVFRVDLRLRPQGGSSPLARSFASYEGYYEAWGELFDRQALIKARYAAGDEHLARAFLSMTEAFAYRTLQDAAEIEDILEEIYRTKLHIEARIAQKEDPRLHVKLGPGGIRDIEFIAQAMQLTRGGVDRSLRARGSINALNALAAAGHLPEEEAARLKEAYRFMRRVENCIQLVSDQQRYSLPSDEAEWERHARRLGYAESPSETFRRDFEQRQTFIRGVFDRLFRADESPFRRMMNRLLDEDSPSPETAEFLLSYGFEDAKSASRALNALAKGSSRVRFSPRVRRAFRDFAEPLLNELKETPDPSLALTQLERFLSASKARVSYFDLLKEAPPIRQLLVKLLGESRFIGDILAQNPVVFETLVGGAQMGERVESPTPLYEKLTAQAARAKEDATLAARRFRQTEMVRIGARDLLGESDVLTTTLELSLLAEAILRYETERMFNELKERRGTPEHEDGSPATYAVIGMGKLAGRELNYSSDLDAQFVYSGPGKTTKGEPNGAFFSRMAATLASQWKRPALGSRFYELDLRLRPYGRGGPAALPLDRYRQYYETHAELWERQAAVKSRPVAGDEPLGEAWSRLAAEFAYSEPLTPDEAEQIYSVRARKENQAARKTGRMQNIKSGYGGLVDIEFLVQALQLRWGLTILSARSPNTLDAMDALTRQGIVEPKVRDELRQAYLYLRRVENRLQIVENRSLAALPDNPAALSQLARRLYYESAEELLSEHQQAAEKVRARFESIFKALMKRPS